MTDNITLRAAQPVEIHINVKNDGTWIAVGERIPFLMSGHGGGEAASKRVLEAIVEMLMSIAGVRGGIEKLDQYLTARGLEFQLVTDGHEIARQTVQLPELALSGV